MNNIVNKEDIIKIIEDVSDFDLSKDIDIDLIEKNILDSLAFIELISELEDRYDVEIQPTKIKLDVWRKVDSIVELVETLIKSK